MVENPFRDSSENSTPSGAMVIFGATGDLTMRKLVPGLFDLASDGLLPVNFYLIGVSHSKIDNAEFRNQIEASIRKFSRHRKSLDSRILAKFLSEAHFISGSFDEGRCYQELKRKLKNLDESSGIELKKVFYYAIAPRFFEAVSRNLNAQDLLINSDNSRVVVEKPFGRDFESARELNRILLELMEEKQIYRIDHYLGKETVQNILVFRFSNGIFEPLWNSKYIDHVEITVSESIGVEHRAGYFDSTGIVRDIAQNHLLQLLCLVALEPPVNFEADSVRDEKVKVLKAIKRYDSSEVDKFAVRARYQSGFVAGKEVPGYLAEAGVDKDSTTETFASFCFAIDNWRWAGVPFFVRTGKRLAKRVTDISIFFKSVPYRLFQEENLRGISPNVLSFQIQPDEGIALKVSSKPPGPSVSVESVKMDFNYGSVFGGEPPGAYERLLLDALKGDASLFTRSDEIEEAWRLVDPILKVWGDTRLKSPVYGYESGTWGPKAADALITKIGGIDWRRL